MLDYIVGILFSFIFVFLLQLFGICLTKKINKYSYSFIVGFVVYSFFVAIVGIPIQIFNFSWTVFFVCMILILLGIVLYIFWSVKTKKIIVTKLEIIDYIKNNWFLYIGAILILIFSLTHLRYIWANNMTDDGYYLNKIATLPYIDNPFTTDPVTGLPQTGLNSYSLNTFELEASFYLFIMNIDPSLYARIFLSLFNYFLMLNAIHAFFITLAGTFKNKMNDVLLQYLVPCLFFIFILCANIFIESDATWTILSAAFYGSSIVRVSCTFIVLLSLINIQKLDYKSIIFTIMTCVVMVSKSTVAVVLLFVLAVSYLLDLCIRNKNKIFGFILICLLFVGGVVLPDNVEINQAMLESFMRLKNLLIIIPLVLMILYSRKYDIYKRILFISIISLFLILCPSVNDIVETVSQFLFVTERTRYSLFIFIWILGLFPLFYDFMLRVKLFKLGCIVSLLLSMFTVFVTGYGDSNILRSGKTYLSNPYIMPQSTILLGETLEKYYDETGAGLKAVMPAGIILNGESHFVSSIIRTYSPHTISVVGGIRIEPELHNEYSEFNGFSIDDFNLISKFYSDATVENVQNIAVLNEKYPFDCFIGVNLTDVHSSLLNSIGYTRYADVKDSLITYNVFVKE